MVSNQVLDDRIPTLFSHDTVGKALELMDELLVNALPVIKDNLFVGSILKSSLEELDDDAILLENLQRTMSPVSLLQDVHIFLVLRQFKFLSQDVVPIVDQNKLYVGSVTTDSLLKKGLLQFCNEHDAMGGLFVLAMDPLQFSVGEISRLVESNNRMIRQLNTYIEETTGLLIATIEINSPEISDVLSTFQRFDYEVRYYFGDESYENSLKTNYEGLINYLNI